MRRIITSRFTDGETFASFNALCRELGFEPCKGKRRKELEKEMRCFFEWEKTGTANEISERARWGWYHYPRSVPHVSETLRGQGVERQTLPLLGLGRRRS